MKGKKRKCACMKFSHRCVACRFERVNVGRTAVPVSREAARIVRGRSEFLHCPKEKAEKIVTFVKMLEAALGTSAGPPTLSSARG